MACRVSKFTRLRMCLEFGREGDIIVPMRRHLRVLGSLLLVGCRPAPSREARVGPVDGLARELASCAPCHQSIVDRYRLTAHYATSAAATAATIKGSFAAGHDVLKTRDTAVSFRMEQRGSRFFQTGVDSRAKRLETQSVDLVIGSGRRGQTYGYWRDGILVELPVSYLTTPDAWINSPGYPDGQIDFTHVIVPRCLECHSTRFTVEQQGGRSRYASQYQLGIGCAKCHGDATAHVAAPTAQNVRNPARFERDRKLDTCGLCHSGPRRLLRPPFSFVAGEPLDQYLVPQTDSSTARPDVHGDQIGLLSRSRCFKQSPQMSCATCHDVHQPERDLTQMSGKCLQCHQADRHPAIRAGGDLKAGCVGCHMPTEESRGLQINGATGRSALSFRSHRIAVYPTGAPVKTR